MAIDTYQNSKYFTANVLRGITVALADRFNQLKIRRYGDDWITVVKEIPVGLNTMIPTKMHLERIEDYTSEGGDARFYQTEPFMNLNLTGISRDSSRSYSSHSQRSLYVGEYNKQIFDSVMGNLQPTPYDFSFSLTIRTNAYEDSSQILEQILPYFNDDNYLRVRELPFINVERQLKVNLESCSPDVSTSLGEEEMRSVNWTIDFVVKGWMYRPIRDVGLIEKIGVLIETESGDPISDYMIHGVRLSDFQILPYGDTIPSDALGIEVYDDAGTLMVRFKQPLEPIPLDALDVNIRDDGTTATYKVYTS